MTDEFRWYLLKQKRVEEHILSSFRAFRLEGIEPILIKGWAADRNYPDNEPRFYGDIDLAVSKADYVRALQLTTTADSGAIGVDLHCELRHLDTLPWSELLLNSELVDLNGEEIRILCAEDHLRVLCVHWLTNGGESRERLWDIVYAVQNRPADFMWEKCLEVVSPNRRGWIVSTIGLAHKYLNLDLEGLPFEEEAKNLPSWLTQCVEREWVRGVQLRPLHTALKDRRVFFQQIGKRIPPNPIQATVDCEGKFDDRSRIPYQLKDVFMRLTPSLKRVLPVFLRRKDEAS